MKPLNKRITFGIISFAITQPVLQLLPPLDKCPACRSGLAFCHYVFCKCEPSLFIHCITSIPRPRPRPLEIGLLGSSCFLLLAIRSRITGRKERRFLSTLDNYCPSFQLLMFTQGTFSLSCQIFINIR